MAARAVQGAFGAVLALARKRWKKAGLAPITLQESRHTAATWLDAAGVPPKIASVLMGHATPARQAGATLGARPFDGRPTRTRPAADLLSLVTPHLILVMRPHLVSIDDADQVPDVYSLLISGHLGPTALSAFPSMVAQLKGGDTLLTGVLDRSALYGVLAEIEALNLDLIELRRLVPRCT